MNRQEFESKLKQANPIGSIMTNPGGGTSEIVAFPDGRVSYIRGSSTISVSLDDLYQAYTEFRGRRVSSSDLKSFAPSVFDSAARPSGHSCNCTFFFLALERASLASDLKGEGVRGSPYSVQLLDA